MSIRSSLAILFLFLASGPASSATALPEGFVFLKEIVPDIRQDIRYAGRNNFMRQRLPGYQSAECVLTEAAAKALGKVQNAAVRAGFSLVTFDCYRPQRAVNAMVAWVADGSGTDQAYFPRVSRSGLVRQGYIGAKSSHARGSTVDVALEPLSGEVAAGRNSASVCARTDRETADFGTPFDCFDPDSRTDSVDVAASARQLRKTLVDLMRKGGFRNYPGEWWHFTLIDEPFPKKSFDFPIKSR
ncbi:M15 family metallopeptidase [Roseibium sp. SCP14]|uniref:M15 family metallopeptidase n=1 Tax=Roseibium sp. SCP14 TaxID=3141375 RepID=UPI00333826FE